MKQKLGHSVYSLFSGQYKREAISLNPRLTLFLAKCQINRPLVRGFKSLQPPFDSNSEEEDSFSELGPAVDQFTELGPRVVQIAGAPLKLATEKPDKIKRNGRYSPSGSSPIFKSILSGLSKGKASPASSPKIDKHNDASGSSAKIKKASNLKISSYVSIEDVPSTVNLPQLIEAISKYGDTSSASMRSLPNGIVCCDVKFENVESSRKAVSAGEIAVGKFRLPISPLSVSETVTKLNSTVIDEHRWSAESLLPRSSKQIASMEEEDDSKEELRSQMSNRVYELKKEASLNRLHAEDIEYLHLSIMHIEDH